MCVPSRGENGEALGDTEDRSLTFRLGLSVTENGETP
jgi:hypothetical protein